MGIIMKEITTKLRHETVRGFKEFAELYYNEGADQADILKTFDSFTKHKIRQYYKNSNQPTRFGKIGFDIKSSDADSKAEIIFAIMLDNNGINYKFQYKIGPYKADFLLSDHIVCELDGPHHLKPEQIEHDNRRDNYMRKLGYKVLRVPISILAIDQCAVVSEIKALLEG